MDSEDHMEEEHIEQDAPVKRFVTYDYYEDAKEFAEFSLDEIDVFVEAFEEYDTDGSGAINAAELSAAFTKMGQGASPEMIKELIEEFDADKSGEIDWKEYLMMMRNFFPWKRLEYVYNYLIPAEKFPEFDADDITIFADAFREADEDKSGNIDTQELRKVFNSMGQGCTEEQAEEILKEFDEDNSGTIEFGEFLEIMRTCFYPIKRILYEVEFYGPAISSPEFSREEIDGLAKSFKKFDKDNSGTIDIKELAAMFKQMGQGASQEDIEIIFEVFDADGSGEIEWPEFIEMIKTFYPWKRAEYEEEFYSTASDFPEFSRKDLDVFSLTFREFDLDGSGSIDARELGIALKKMGQGASPEKIKSLIAEVDDNGNGELEWPEYLKIMRGFYPNKMKDFQKQYLEPAKNFPEFDEEDILVFVEAFRDYDLDGSGAIDAKELAAAFRRMGQGASPEKIAKIIADVDDNGNGEVDWPEFLTIMRNMYSGRTNAEPAKAPAKTSTPVKSSTPATTPSKTTTQAPAKTTVTTTPTKSTTTSSPASTPTKTSSPAPVKTTATTTTPTKTVTSTTPAKTTSSPSSSAPTPTKSSSSSAPTPTKTTFGAAKPSSSGSGTASTFASHRASNQCPVCSKTVYPIEAVTANEQTFHKNCFRCQEPGCSVSLTLSTFKGVSGKVYCQKHVPAAKPTQLTVQGSMSTANAVNAPKLSKSPGIKKNERMTFAPGELRPVGSEDSEEN